MASRSGTRGEASRIVGALAALVLALVAIALGACGGDDDDEDGGESPASTETLSTTLPNADDLGLEVRSEAEWDNADDIFDGNSTESLVIGGATDPDDLGAQVEDAGFQTAVGSGVGGKDLNVRMVAMQFDSDEGALEARDLLHEEDLKSPCPDECIVSPLEYELDDVPDSAAAHHVPNEDNGPVEAHHAEFVIGPNLYVVQVDGKPSPTFSADFDELMQTVHESASSAN